MPTEASAPQLTLDIERKDTTATVRLHGKLVYGVGDVLYSNVSKLIPECKRIILDLTDLSVMDSSRIHSNWIEGKLPTLKRSDTSTLLLILSLLIANAVNGQAMECPPGCSPGRWSKDAVDLSTERQKAPYESRDILIFAPDHQKRAHILKDHWWIEDGAKRIAVKDSLLLYPAEFAWAPDSRAFFITAGTGYTTGYEVRLYRIVGGEIISIGELSKTVRLDFERRHRCFEYGIGNDPNIAGIKWLNGSERILVVAEVPPLGICKEADYFGGYEISTSSDEILRRLSPQELVAGWGQVMGERLKGDFELLSARAKSRMP